MTTNYQIADIGAKAITKGDTWERLIGLMGIKAPGESTKSAKADVTTNKAGQKTTSKSSAQQCIGQSELIRDSMQLALTSAPTVVQRSVGRQGIRSGTPPSRLAQDSGIRSSGKVVRKCTECNTMGSDTADCLPCLISNVHPSSHPRPPEVLRAATPTTTKTNQASKASRRRARRAMKITSTTMDAIDLT